MRIRLQVAWAILLASCQFAEEPATESTTRPVTIPHARYVFSCDGEQPVHRIELFEEPADCDTKRSPRLAFPLTAGPVEGVVCDEDDCRPTSVEVVIGEAHLGSGATGSWAAGSLGNGTFRASWCSDARGSADDATLIEAEFGQGPLYTPGEQMRFIEGRSAVVVANVVADRPGPFIVETTIRVDGVERSHHEEAALFLRSKRERDDFITLTIDGDDIVRQMTIETRVSDPTSCRPHHILDTFIARPNVAPAKRLELVIVPTVFAFDDSFRRPHILEEPDGIEQLVDALMAVFPVSSVDVRVRTPIVWDEPFEWTAYLARIVAVRAEDDALDTEFYYGLISPTEDERTFYEETCTGFNALCAAGVARLADDDDPSEQAAVGVGFRFAADTLAHELGHMLGRRHAPCGPTRYEDRDYPYDDAAIGRPGYDLVNDEHHPAHHKDFMSYCGPDFVSDYTFDASRARLTLVQRRRRIAPPVKTSWRLAFERNGSLILADELDAPTPKTNDQFEVTYVHGRERSSATAFAVPVEHGSKLFYLPVPERRPDAVEIGELEPALW